MQRASRRIVVGAVAAAVVALTVIAVATSPDGGGGAPLRGEDAVSAPLEFFDGTTGDLADFTGTPLVINFWASWCPPCAAEMPEFAAVDAEFGDRVTFLGLNMQEISLEAARRLIEVTGVQYRMAHDRDGALYRMFGGIAMPTTVFVAADGTVARVHGGVLFEDDLRSIIEQELLS